MCAPLTLHDDAPEDTEALRAFDAVVAAERKRLHMALQIAGGATRYGFPQHNADAAIREMVGNVVAARHTLDRLIVSRAMGQRCVLVPTQHLQGIELQARVTRNEAARGMPGRLPALVAADAVDATDRAHVPDAYQHGFTSPAAA